MTIKPTNLLKSLWDQNRVSAFVAIGYVVLMTMACLWMREPVEPFVQRIHWMVRSMALPVILLYAAAWNLIKLNQGNLSFVRIALVGWLNYWLTLWFIGNFGDRLYRYVLDTPQDAAAAALFVCICAVLIRAGHMIALPQMPETAHPNAIAYATTINRHPVSASDLKIAAAHEAGHALTHCALKELPEHMEVVIHNGQTEKLGHITNIGIEDRLSSQTMAEWQMLTFLAGHEGVIAHTGEAFLGSSNDHMRWQSIARMYLSNFHEGTYYTQPANPMEAELNDKALLALQRKQQAMLKQLFSLNVLVHEKLTATLLEKRRIDKEELASILSTAKLPAGFPQPNWEPTRNSSTSAPVLA